MAGFEIWHFPVANVAPVEAKATIAAINRAGAGSPGLFTPDTDCRWLGAALCGMPAASK